MEALLKTSSPVAPEQQQFCEDMLAGLRSKPKKLDSKYFYDSQGDRLFQQIMNCEEYYLTDCEMEIFSAQTGAIAETLLQGGQPFDLIELGAGDATKSVHLLRELHRRQATFTYLPVDISKHVIASLNATLPLALPGLKIKGLCGEYFSMLEKAASISSNRKVLLFMGSNIGNMPVGAAHDFCRELRRHLSPGDLAIIGFDLKKDPATILAAYNDASGITSKFNLNLLQRMNRELGANFISDQFKHYACYDPETGACKSYLISTVQQEVILLGNHIVRFDKDEYIWMEISQKYSEPEIAGMAAGAGFKQLKSFNDSRNWFTDVAWQVE